MNLDNLDTIQKIDKYNMRKLLYEFPHQQRVISESIEKFTFPAHYRKVKNIVVTGMGGSSIGGEIVKNLLRERLKIPLIVNKSYTLPSFVNEESLLICVSYSGNTEETLSAYKLGKEYGSKIVVVSSGGELISFAKEDGFPYLVVPGGMPPRCALGYLFFSQLFLIQKLNLVSIEQKELVEAEEIVKELAEEMKIESPKNKNVAKKIADEIYSTIPVIYATFDFFEAVGMRWKTQINENSKNPAYYEFFPELDHNEIMGWEKSPEIEKKFSVVLLRDKAESERIKKRITITKEIIKNNAGKILEIGSRGEGLLARIFSLIYIGDWVSFYLAILKGVDPTEIKSINELKVRMAK